MTLEQVLGKIKDEHGKSALRDGQSLLGLFQDYSHNQLRPQANALRTFLDCKGNQRILNLCSEPSQKQQTEYHRLIQEMVRDYNMQEATAADVCAAFWRVAIGTEPPISKSTQEPKPVHFSAPVVDTTAETVREHYGVTSSRVPAPKVKEQSPFRRHLDEMGKKERKAFLFGLAGVVILSLALILVMIKLAMDARTSDVSDRLVGIAILVCYLGITLWRMKRLWQTGFSFHPAGGFLSAISKVYSTFAEAIHWIFIIAGVVDPVLMPIISDTILEPPAIYISMVVMLLGMAACSAFHASWHKNKKKD